ncbi:MAG TPA: glucose 1-dehydrogenase [Acidimicrobiia bacterium]|nr:glucose 1-dehydrogenase [Acidimicrobiia bacterium]
MRALTVLPGVAGSAEVTEVDDPPEADGPLLVETLAVGVCGTDAEICAGRYGTAPPGGGRLIIGHESLGRVLDAPDGTGFRTGDLVVGIVRRPDPVPCPSCAIGEWDMCSNGRYTERGIKGRHGYASERYRIEPTFAVRVDPVLGELGVLVEPASVVAKAWDHIERIGARSQGWSPRRVLVCGAGPIGLLAALLAVRRGYEVEVLDRVTRGPKPRLVADVGAHYRNGDVRPAAAMADIVIECSGASAVVGGVLSNTNENVIVCLTGVSSGGRTVPFDAGEVNREMVLGNAVVFGSVNANRRHYAAAADALREADPAWLARLVTRRVPLDAFADALEHRPDDVKTVITLTT